MPFMIGPAPIRRTLKYLDAGRLVLKDQIKIMTVNYHVKGTHHQGTRDFVFWYLPQIQYKNPTVQIATLKLLTPTPYIRCFYDTGNQMIIDTHNRNKEEIFEHLIKVVGKTKKGLMVDMPFVIDLNVCNDAPSLNLFRMATINANIVGWLDGSGQFVDPVAFNPLIEVLDAETIAREKKDNPANFGVGCERNCICEVLGQVPCPATCPVPKEWRGKYKNRIDD